MENVEKVVWFTLEVLVWTRKRRVCVTNASHVIINHHSIQFSPLFKNDKKSKHKLWGCVKYKIRNEVTIQCVSQYF